MGLDQELIADCFQAQGFYGYPGLRIRDPIHYLLRNLEIYIKNGRK